uniref:C2H2-type domain-containing protein n=1 Tax=Fibrocapsa japonica TaxID=94617 RepID=A0A7S2V0D6_9STRA|mmetsp:Transcript_1955/g.2792  ORF Transcript_1955/g.2792 Transcript_1955/m.2792 type:complete len:136 (+) Transcript_1955:53-460(+)
MRKGRTHNTKRAHAKKKQYKRGHATKNRRRDIDQIQGDLDKEKETGKKTEFAWDDDLAGGGQHYCTACAQHFIDDKTLKTHVKSKRHKRSVKDAAQERHSQEAAEAAAGMTKEILPPAHGGGARSAGGMDTTSAA